jgi:O-antigen ligase
MIERLDARALRQPAIVLAAALALAIVVVQLEARGLLALVPALIFFVLLGFAIARYPEAGFALLIFSVPFQRLGSEGTALPVTLTQLVFPIAVVGFLISHIAHRRPIRGHIILIPYTLLILVMLASLIQAQSLNPGLAEIARWLVALASFWLALQLIVGGSDRRLVGVIALLAAGGVFEALIGVVQSVIGVGPFQISSGVSRAFGTFGRPNSFAGYLEMTLFPAIAITIWYAGETLRRYRTYASQRLQGMTESQIARKSFFRAVLATTLFGGSAAIILSGIVASLSRGAWFGVVIGTLAIALLFGPVSRILVAMATISLVAVLIGGQAGIVPANYRDRISESFAQFRPFDVRNVTITDENFAAAERVAHWQTGWNMYQDHPAIGVGVGNFNVRFEDYSVREMFRKSQGHAHNYYIHTLAETGLIGLLVYLTLLGSIIALALQVLLQSRRGDGLSRAIVLGAFGSIMAVSAHNMFEDLHVLNLGIVISLLWALVIAGHERWRSGEHLVA